MPRSAPFHPEGSSGSSRPGGELSAEVVSSGPGRRAVLALAGREVPVESSVELAVGDRLRVRFEGEALRVVRSGRTEPALARAFALATGTRPVGESLLELANLLRATGQDPSAVASLEAALAARDFTPTVGAETLAARLGGLGTSAEARLFLLAHAGAEGGTPDAALLVRDLATLLLQRAAGAGATRLAGFAEFRASFEAVVQNLLAHAAPEPAGDAPALDRRLARFFEALRAELATVVAHEPASSAAVARTRERIQAGLRGSSFESAVHGTEGELVRLLFGGAGASRHRAWARVAHRELEVALRAFLRDSPSSSLGRSVERVLASLEQEELWNLVRAEAGDPARFELPIADGSRALLFVHPEDARTSGDAGSSAPRRFTLGVDFRGLGPVRADVILKDDLLATRLVVTREDLARRVRSDLGTLQEHLAIGGRRVLVAVVHGTVQQASVSDLERGVHRERPLLDRAG